MTKSVKKFQPQKMFGQTKTYQELNEFIRWQIQHRIFDVNAKYVSHQDLIF